VQLLVHGSFNVFLIIDCACTGIINILFHDGLGRDDFSFIDHLSNQVRSLFHSNEGIPDPHSSSRRRSIHSLEISSGGCCPVYIVPHMSPVGRNNGNIFFFLICSREHLSFIEQKTQLFYEGIFTLLRECIKQLMMSKAHCFHMPAVLLWSERSAGTFLQRLLERARFQTRIYRHKSIVFSVQ